MTRETYDKIKGHAVTQSDSEPQDKTDKWDRKHAKRRVIVQDENGRFEAIDKPTLAQSSNAELKQDVRDKLLRALERRRFVDEGGRYLLTQSQSFDAFTEVIADFPALAQSDAEPVAWQIERMRVALGKISSICRDSVADVPPPRPDASAGLIEAAPDDVSEAATRIVNRIWKQTAISVDAATEIHGICQEEIEALCARAADRSGK